MIDAPRDVGQYDADTIARARRDVLAKVRRTLGVDVEPLIAVEEVLDPPTIGARTSATRAACTAPAATLLGGLPAAPQLPPARAGPAFLRRQRASGVASRSPCSAPASP